MTRSYCKISETLLDRISANFPAPAIFHADEVGLWPVGAVASLIEAGILSRTIRAKWATCYGCDWQCRKPVTVRRADGRVAHWVYIECDEEPDLGRQPFELVDLDRYRTTLGCIADFVAKELTRGEPRASPLGDKIKIGQFRGRFGERPTSVVVRDDAVWLEVGQEAERLAQILVWESGGLAVDKRRVRRMANRKTKPISSGGQQPATSMRPRLTPTQLRNRRLFATAAPKLANGSSVTDVAKELARERLAGRGTQSISWQTIRRILTKMRNERLLKRSKRA